MGLPPEDIEPVPLRRLRLPLGYILPAFSRYVKWGVYPHGGGFNTALEDVIEDFKTLQYQLNYRVQQERRKSGK